MAYVFYNRIESNVKICGDRDCIVNFYNVISGVIDFTVVFGAYICIALVVIDRLGEIYRVAIQRVLGIAIRIIVVRGVLTVLVGFCKRF